MGTYIRWKGVKRYAMWHIARPGCKERRTLCGRKPPEAVERTSAEQDPARVCYCCWAIRKGGLNGATLAPQS